jgi:sugar transferase (PEP-CTERM/EpsH1 system associated)
MIRHLSQRHDVVVASLAASAEELQQGQRLRELGVELIAELLPPSTRWRQAVSALPTTQPSSAAYFWSSRLKRRVDTAAAHTGFDGIIVHCAFMGRYLEGLTSGFRLLDFGDIDSGKWSSYARHRAWPLSMGYALEAHKLSRHERMLADAVDRITVTTSGERDELRRIGSPRPATIVPNGVDVTYFQEAANRRVDTRALVFLGRMDYFPNIDGIHFFAHEIFPLVRRKLPDASLCVVGSNPVPSVRRLARLDGVTVTGSVPDVRPFLRDAVISVAPLRLARGTQNKILESMASGLPVVATSAAAKGIQATPGRHLLVGDDPTAFAEAVVALLEDAVRREDLVAAARREVLSAHDWSASMRILDAVIDGRA